MVRSGNRPQRKKEKGELEALKAAAAGSMAGSRAAGDVEEDLWLCPVDDRRRLGGRRAGLLKGFSLGSCFSTNRARLRQLAQERGVHHLDNLVSAPA